MVRNDAKAPGNSTPAGSSSRHLARLAAMANKSPVVQAQLALKDMIQSGGARQSPKESVPGVRPVQTQAGNEAEASKDGHWIVGVIPANKNLQVGKQEFLTLLRERVTGVADAVLARVGQNSSACPYISYWLEYYAGKDAAHIEAAILRYAPAAAHAAGWKDLLDMVVDRVRFGFEQHVKNGSLEGVPDELPKDLHDNQPASGPVLQACFDCCSDTGEQTHLIHQSSSSKSDYPILTNYLSTEELDVPEPDSLVNLAAWTSSGKSLPGAYPIYYQVKSHNYKVIATTPPVLQNARVVANSFLQSGKSGEEEIYFTSFDSNPPFAGLGRFALDLLQSQSGKRPVPSGPVPGAYSAYFNMGMEGFSVSGDVLKAVASLTGLTKKIKQEGFSEDTLGELRKLTGTSEEIEPGPFDLQNEEHRSVLKTIQERIKQIEQLKMGSKISYKAPKLR